MNIKHKIIIIIVGLLLLLTPMPAKAQSAISLSISPPITEVLIQPGKEFKQDFTISNQGGKTTLNPKIVYFYPADEDGNVSLTEKPAPEWIRYHSDSFTLESGESKNFSVLISPPENTEEIDHYLSLVFETNSPTDLLYQNSTLYTAKIVSNILISVTKDGNPKKSAQIVIFNAPKLVDSLFGKIDYEVNLRNNGNGFWKPIGKITTASQTLNLAPQNILSGSKRNILCVKEENLKKCFLDEKPFWGKLTSKLEFSTDENGQIYQAVISTFIFPFSLLGASGLIFALIVLTKIYPRRHSS